MEVILKENLKGTGNAGDVVKVSDGYARNMLIPKGIAIEATKGNLRMLEKQKADEAKRRKEEKSKAEEIKLQFAKSKVKISMKSGEGGRLFGSVTSKDIADAVKEQLNIELDKRKIVLDAPIKELGVFNIEIKLFQDVKGTLRVEIAS